MSPMWKPSATLIGSQDIHTHGVQEHTGHVGSTGLRVRKIQAP